MIDAAEGAQSEITTILIRMRELSIQAGNDTNNVQDRANLQLEIDQLTAEIDRISEVTTWAGVDLLNGRGGVDGNGTLRFQVGSGTNSEDMITTQINSVSSAALGVGTPDAAAALTDVTGGTKSGSNAVLSANTASSVTIAGTTVRTDFSFAAGTSTTLAFATANGAAELTVGSPTAGSKVAAVVNGETIEVVSTGTNTTDATNLASAIGAKFSYLTTSVSSATITVSATAANKATYLASQLNAGSGFSALFSADGTTTSGTVAISPLVKAPAMASSATTHDTGASGFKVDTNANKFSVTAAAGTISSSVNSDVTLTVDGKQISFNTWTDAAAKGYTTTSASSLAQAIIQKIEDSGIAGLTFSEASGVITITKSGAIDISSAANAQASVNLVDAAIAQVNEQRAKLGAISNRLEMTVSNLTNIVTNLQTGRGRIEDADFAAESTELAKTQILQQASMAMLSQANASKQSVMNLLQGR